MANALRTTRRRKEAGYTLLYAVFLVATMMIAASAVYTRVDTEGRRQKEEEMIWRGNQYARAVGLYFRKFGKFPTRIEDLTNQTNGVRFLRQAYTDPMNKEDGSWRFIHVVNGQLVDSLRPASLLQNAIRPDGAAAVARRGWPTNRHGGKYFARHDVGLPTPAAWRRCDGRKHHRRRKQGKKAFFAGLPGRRHLRGMGIHLEPGGAARSWAKQPRNRPESERPADAGAGHNSSPAAARSVE
jgi:hypothetical protein